MFITASLFQASVSYGADKLVVKDSGGTNQKFVVTDSGTVSVGTSSTIYPLFITSDIAGNVPGGVGMFMLTGNANKERIELRSPGEAGLRGAAVQGKGYGGTIESPTATQQDAILMILGGSGHDGNQIIVPNKAGIFMMSGENWNTTSNGTYMRFDTTSNGSTTKTEKMRVTGDGSVGIGTTAPTALFDVNSNGIRIRNSRTPASAGESCNQGDMAWDAGYVYVCVAQNSWKRANLAAW